jgi:hypothetical protein
MKRAVVNRVNTQTTMGTKKAATAKLMNVPIAPGQVVEPVEALAYMDLGKRMRRVT